MLYLEIYDQKMLIAYTRGNRIVTHKIIELPLLTITQGIIFNSDQLLIHINEFIHINNLKKPKIIINAPSLQQKTDLSQTPAIFQHALIISKANIQIQKIIAGPNSENNIMQSEYINNIPKMISDNTYIDLLLQIQSTSHTNPIPWLSLTTIYMACTILILVLITRTQRHELQALMQTQASLQPIITNLESKMKDLTNTKTLNAGLSQIINKAHTYQLKNQNPQPILASISKSIPNNVWLTKIELGNDKKLKHLSNEPIKKKEDIAKPHKLALVGCSHRIESPLTFIKKLSHSKTNISDLKLTYLKKMRSPNVQNAPKATEKKYEFKADGDLA